jgi:hypothetical protein
MSNLPSAGSLFQNIAFDDGPGEKDPRCVVRLTTNCYFSGSRAVFTKTVSLLKRRSQLRFDDISFDHEADIDFSAIVNLNEVEDGIYYLDPHETESDGDEYSSWWYAISWKLVPWDK